MNPQTQAALHSGDRSATASDQTNTVLDGSVSGRHPTHDEAHQPSRQKDPLLTVDDVAERLNVTKDWVWDHSSRKAPYLPVIRMGDGTLRYRASKIEEFIDERERLSNLRHKKVK